MKPKDFEKALNRRDAVQRARDIFTQRHGDGPLEEWSEALWGGVITQQGTDTVMEGIYYFPAHGSGYRSDPDHLIWLLVFEGPVVVAEGRTYTRYQAIAFSADNGSFKGIYPVRSFEIDIWRLENLTAYIR